MLTFTLVPMDVPKALVLSLSNLLTMLGTQFNNSMAMIGKDALWKFVKIDLPALDQDLADVVDLEVPVEGSGVGEVLVRGGA